MSEAVTGPRACAHGSWYAVLADGLTVLLPPDQRGRVAELWQLVDGGAGFEELLDALLARGLRDLSGFALVGRDGDRTRVLLRGPASARFETVEGPVRLAGDDTGIWTEHTLTGVTGGVVEVESAAAAARSVLATGLTRVSRVELGAAVGAAQDQAPAEPPAEREPAVEPVAGPEPASAEHDGLTGAGRPAPLVDRPPHGIPGQQPAPAVTSRPVARLVFSTGEVVDVDRAILVGRAPEARRFASHDQPRLVTVASVNQEISSTHLEIRPGAGADHGMAVVTDLGSTNGTVVVQPGLPPEDLRAGIAVALIPGAVLDLGDGVTIQATTA